MDEAQESSGQPAQDSIDTSVSGDPEAVEDIAADMQKLSADWQRVQGALQEARQADGPRDAVVQLQTVREGCAAHLEELQRMRRKAIEALPSEMRGSVLDTFGKFHDDISAQLESVDEEMQRLRSEFNPLFRPPQ